jgi:hypothetical protein
MAIRSFGITVTLGATAITGLTDVQISGRDVNDIETTTHGSSGNAKSFIGGLIDNGTLELTGNFSGSHAGIAYMEDALGTVVAAVVTYSDTSTHTFSVVIHPPTVTNGIDGLIEFTASHKITGAIGGTATA